MIVGQGQLKEIITSLHPAALSPVDAETILELSQLTLDADGREDADEIKMFFALGKVVFGLAGMAEAPTPTFMGNDDDRERMVELAGKLSTPAAKELAFACAHLLSISDVDIAPEEDAFVGEMVTALGLDGDRADALVAQLNAAITPPA